MTKKILAILMALVLTFAMTTVAFADTVWQDPNTSVSNGVYNDIESFTLTKVYKLLSEGMKNPEETFTFTIGNASYDGQGGTITSIPMPTIKGDADDTTDDQTTTLSFAEGEVVTTGTAKNLTITLPTYSAVGEYTYQISETNNEIAGVDYRNEAITMKVTVINDGTDDSKKIRVVSVNLTNSENKKVYSFDDNTYTAGAFTIGKTVSGAFGDKAMDFDMVVTMTSAKKVNSTITYDGNKTIAASAWKYDDTTKIWTATAPIAIGHGESTTFTNVPKGVIYTVKEDNKYFANSETDPADGYDMVEYATSETATYDTNNKPTANNGSTEVTVDNSTTRVQVLNNRGGSIDTGITMDSIPYIVLLAVVAIGVVAMLLKKRHEA